MTSVLRPAVSVFLVLTMITGVFYPLTVTLIAQGVFPYQANGSVIERPSHKTSAAEADASPVINRDWWGRPDAGNDAEVGVGSTLVGQPFSSPNYFWGRPSATGPLPYNGAASIGGNYGPTNPAQLDAAQQRIAALREAQGDAKSPTPIELVTASASGLDPHISPAAADYQVPRVAKARGLGEYEVRRLVAEHIEPRTLGVLGERRINVLQLNLALDQLNSNEQ